MILNIFSNLKFGKNLAVKLQLFRFACADFICSAYPVGGRDVSGIGRNTDTHHRKICDGHRI